MADNISVEQNNIAEISALLKGKKIVSIERELDHPEDWSHANNSVTIVLDDGAVLRFDGWGHDASGLNTTYTPALIESKVG